MYLSCLRWILTCMICFLLLEVAIAAVAYEATRSTLPDYKYDILIRNLQDIEFKEDISNGTVELDSDENKLSNHYGGSSCSNKLIKNIFDEVLLSLDYSEDEISCLEEQVFYYKYPDDFVYDGVEINNHTENTSNQSIFVDEYENINYNMPSVDKFVVPKCCRKGEQLDSGISRCIPRPGHKIENTSEEFLNKSNNFRDAYWTKFLTKGIEYMAVYNTLENLLFGGPILLKRIVNESEVLILAPGYTRVKSNNITQCSISDIVEDYSDVCFDAVESGPFAPHVFVSDFCNYGMPCLSKCCLPGQMLSKEGLCVTKNENSSFYARDIQRSSDLLPYSHAPCMEKRYDVADISSCNNYMMKGSVMDFSYYMESHDLKLRCVDWQEAGDGVVKKVLGTCSVLSNVKLFLSVRPLGIVTVLLLGAAIVMTISREEMRRSVHGRALASHAFCLMAANSLQVAAFYSEGDDTCSDFVIYSHPATYFFLVAGNSWLSSMTLNMLHSFRQPLGALASASHSVVSEMRKRYVLMSVFSWGIPSSLTAFAMYMVKNRRRMRKNGYYTPTFGETRICFVDRFSSRYKKDAGAIPMGPLLYFYLPVGLLVLINFLCVIFVMWKMRQLKRGNDVLGGAHIGSRQSRVKNALVYVKLLLMAGLVELCLEVSSWTTGYSYDEYVFYITNKHILENGYSLSISATFVDLSRAVIVLWLCIRQQEKVFWLCKPQYCLDIWRQIFCQKVCASPNLEESQDTYL